MVIDSLINNFLKFIEIAFKKIGPFGSFVAFFFIGLSFHFQFNFIYVIYSKETLFMTEKANIISCVVLITTSFIFSIILSLIEAPYGRYSKRTGWGRLISSKTAWVIMESPNVIISLIVYIISQYQEVPVPLPNLILMLLFILHYINRAYIYPLRIQEGSPMPLVVMLSAAFFCTWNSLNQSSYFFIIRQYPDSWVYDPRFIIGVLLFLIGAAINIISDEVLLSLRRKKVTASEGKEEKFMYTIPSGYMFTYVTSANYFGEIVEWFGFAIASWSLPGLAFAIATSCNMIPRAVKHHQWYRDKFEEYPKERKAVIPFVL